MALSWNHYEAIGAHLRSLDAIALVEIDTAFHTIFGKFRSSLIRIATHTQEYKDALALYFQQCVNAAKDCIARLSKAGQPTPAGFLEDLIRALTWPEDADVSMPYPLPTRSFIAWIFDLFASIPNAVDEVSFPPLIARVADESISRRLHYTLIRFLFMTTNRLALAKRKTSLPRSSKLLRLTST